MTGAAHNVSILPIAMPFARSFSFASGESSLSDGRSASRASYVATNPSIVSWRSLPANFAVDLYAPGFFARAFFGVLDLASFGST